MENRPIICWLDSKFQEERCYSRTHPPTPPTTSLQPRLSEPELILFQKGSWFPERREEIDVNAYFESSLPLPFPVSPRRKRIREECAHAQQRQAAKMVKRAARAGGADVLDVGTMVNVGVNRVDRGRVDSPFLLCVVVEVTKNKSYRLATQGGVLDTTYRISRVIL